MWSLRRERFFAGLFRSPHTRCSGTEQTLEGEIHIGIIDAESDLSITIKKMGGTTLVLNKKDIKSLTALGKSLMMEGLEGNMTVQDMADLLAYLQSNK